MAGTKCLGDSNHNWCHNECNAGKIAQGIRIEATRHFLNAYGGVSQITTLGFAGFPTSSTERLTLEVTSLSSCRLFKDTITIPQYLEGASDNDVWEWLKSYINNSLGFQSLTTEPISFDDAAYSFTLVGPIGQVQNYSVTVLPVGGTWDSIVNIDQAALPVGENIPVGVVVHQSAEKDSFNCVKLPELAYPDEVFVGITTDCGESTITEGRQPGPNYEANTKAGYRPRQYVDVLEEGLIHVKLEFYDSVAMVKHQQAIYNLTDVNYLPGSIAAIVVGGPVPSGWTVFPVNAKFEFCTGRCAKLYIDQGYSPE